MYHERLDKVDVFSGYLFGGFSLWCSVEKDVPHYVQSDSSGN